MTTLSTTAHNPLVRALHRSGLLAEDLDYHVVRASMVIMFLFFGYQKWFPYEYRKMMDMCCATFAPLLPAYYSLRVHRGAPSRVRDGSRVASFIDGRLPYMSNFYCHPGRADSAESGDLLSD